MKYFLFFLITYIGAAFWGCSSTYTLKDFSSREKFYEDFNNFAADKNINIILINDTSITASYGGSISNDTLDAITNVQEIGKKLLKIEIKEIKYYYKTNFTHPECRVILQNGKEFNEKNISILPDSSVEYTVTKKINRSFPINKVKEITYKNHWLGVPARFFSGIISGAVIGFWAYSIITSNNEGANDAGFAFTAGIGLGGLIGGVLGWLKGYNYTYQFNP